jgi:hypothetical protein
MKNSILNQKLVSLYHLCTNKHQFEAFFLFTAMVTKRYVTKKFCNIIPLQLEVCSPKVCFSDSGRLCQPNLTKAKSAPDLTVSK